MVKTRPRTRERFLRYLIPILIGMAGLLFSRQIDNTLLRFSIVMISVAIPLFAGGNLLARYGSQGRAKYVLLIGVIMLLVGAAASLSDFADIFAEKQVFAQPAAEISRWLGMFSLFLGLFVVLFSLVRTGEAVEEVGERFRNLADLMSEGFVLSSPAGTIVLVNQRFLDMFGVTEDMVVGENAADLVERLQVDSVASHLDMRAKGLASEYEITWHVRGEERQFWMSGTPIFDRWGRRSGTLATVRDVTEKNRMAKRLERYAKNLQELVEEQTQKLMQSEAEFRDLLLYMSEGFVTVDASYRVRFANNRICELLKIAPDILRSREIFDFVDAPDRMRLMDLLRSGKPGEEAWPQVELNLLCVDGESVSVMAAVAPVHNPGGRETEYSLVITNVSELKRMQRQLESRATELEVANEELRAHGRAKDGFLSNVSHELKTPLSTINGYVEMLESGSLGQLEAPQLSALKVMGRNVKRLVGLINEMIEFSRMEIRGIQLQVTLFNAGKLARECVASVQPHALAKDISVSIFVPDNFPPVWADRDKISQVLGILLSNAVKFSHEGGMIQVRLSEQSQHSLAISVSDTGIGIDPAYHNRVFDKFFQIDGSMTRRYEGTGIGLSIAKSIVEAHGGGIDLQSELNKGSAFTILLPNAVFDSTVFAEYSSGLDMLKVLVVAEGETFRKTLCSVLTQYGCAVNDANNGYECVRLAEDTQPDVILFNEVMADVAGLTAITSLHQNPATDRVPVIVLSCEDAAKFRAVADLSPAAHLLHKPFTAQALIRRIRQVCLGDGFEEAAPAAIPRTEPRVMVVDPDEDFLDWIEAALRKRNIQCYRATGPTQAVERIQRDPPDVVFLDIDGATSSTGKTLAVLRGLPSDREIPICIMSGLLSQGHGLPEGAAASLRKPFGIEEMVSIVKELRPAAPV